MHDRRTTAPLYAAATSFPLVALGLGVATLQLACGGAPPDDLAFEMRRDTIDGVEVVTIGAGSVWGAPARVVQDLEIGQLEGPDETMFAQIMDMAVDDAGGIYVFDGQIKELRYFDSEGRFVRRVGREGSGPGEYGDTSIGLFVRSDGRVLLRDMRNGRINVYEPDGSPAATWPVATGLFISQATMLGADDHVYVRTLTGRVQPDEPWPFATLHLDAEGTVLDTIPEPVLEDEPAQSNSYFAPRKVWTLSRTGAVVVGTGATYSFEIRHPDGTVTRVEKAWTPVAIPSEEKEQWEAMTAWMSKQPGAPEVDPVPDTKPAFRAVYPGVDGTIWIHRHVESISVEPSAPPEGMSDPPPPISYSEPMVLDAFEADGTYLGEVRLPRRTRALVFSRDMLWGVRRGDLDEQYVVRFRIEDPRETLEIANGN